MNTCTTCFDKAFCRIFENTIFLQKFCYQATKNKHQVISTLKKDIQVGTKSLSCHFRKKFAAIQIHTKIKSKLRN